MRHPDLNPLTQAVLLSLVAVLTAIVFFRVALLFLKQYAGTSHRYPNSWTIEQIKMFERLRMSIGACLNITWLTLLIAAPRMPVSWPFGLEQTLLTVGLLLLSNGWLLLLIPANWENSIFSKIRFDIGFAVVALWWITLLSGIFVTIGWATERHVHFFFPLGTFA